MTTIQKSLNILAILAITFVLIFNANAETTAFGLTVGLTTKDEMKSKYRVKSVGINKWSHGPMFEISPEQVNFEGLQELTAIYNQNGVLVVILADFRKEKFRYLDELLGNKYELVERRVPHVGDKFVNYRNDDVKIELDAKHMSFQTRLSYLHQTFLDSYKQHSAEEQKRERQGDASKL